MKPTIKTVENLASLRQFVDFPFQLYHHHPLWVPPFKASEMAWLNPAKNPAFLHAEVKLFTAWQGSRMVGRAAAIINQMETDHIGAKHARFGWLDFVDDHQVSTALFKAMEDWAIMHGCVRLKGPYGFNSLDKNGMLVEGFDQMGAMTTLYNYEFYPTHLTQLGFQKELEWLEIKAVLPNPFPEKITRAAALIQKRYHLNIRRPKNKLEMLTLGGLLFKMLEETYHELPSYVPISADQQALYIKNYMGVLPPKFVCIVEHETEGPVGFGLTMPTMSKAMQKANGRLWPFGFIHLLLAQHFNESGDLTLIGVKEDWRKKGVHSVIFSDLGQTFVKMGYSHFNVNPMLENNQNVLALWKDFDHRIYKRRRTFYKDLV